MAKAMLGAQYLGLGATGAWLLTYVVLLMWKSSRCRDLQYRPHPYKAVGLACIGAAAITPTLWLPGGRLSKAFLATSVILILTWISLLRVRERGDDGIGFRPLHLIMYCILASLIPLALRLSDLRKDLYMFGAGCGLTIAISSLASIGTARRDWSDVSVGLAIGFGMVGLVVGDETWRVALQWAGMLALCIGIISDRRSRRKADESGCVSRQ